MLIFEKVVNQIDIIKRLDVNYWTPREELDNNSYFKIQPLESWVGSDQVDTSAFYPAISHLYKKHDDPGDLIPFLRVKDARGLLLDFSETVFLDEDVVEENSSSIKKVFPGDVVITKGGEYIGESALVPNYYEEYSICRDLLTIRTQDSPLPGEYLTSFFQSKYGKNELIRTKSIQGQPHLTLEKVREINIPKFGEIFVETIKEYWKNFFSLIEESDSHLETAINLIVGFLPVSILKKDGYSSFDTNLIDINIPRRLDFDYYENRWSNLVSNLEKEGVSFEEVHFETETFKPDDPQKYYKYISLSEVDELSGRIIDYQELPAFDLPDRAKRKVKFKDVIVSSLRGSKDKIAIVNINDDNLIASNGFFVLSSPNLSAETLYTILRSDFYDLFIIQMATGSIMSSITQKYFSQLKFPIIDKTAQSRIDQEISKYLEKRTLAFSSIQDATQLFDDEIRNCIIH